MQVRNLETLKTEEVIECFLAAFSNYFVVLPADVEYWKARFKAAQIDWSLSFGVFDGTKLVGFIINGIDIHQGKKTAYNSGTGVLPNYRGRAIVDKLYAHAIPEFHKAGIEKCLLEVIRENDRAKKVYSRIGFTIKRGLNSFKGELPENDAPFHLKKVSYKHISESGLYNPHYYSWDNLAKAVEISEANKKSYLLTDKNDAVSGYFTLGPGGQVVQLEAVNDHHISEVLKSLGNVSGELRFANIPDERKELISELNSLGFENTINQYEMEYHLV